MSNSGGSKESEQEEKDKYVPPAERLITPADVVDLDPSMTVRSKICSII